MRCLFSVLTLVLLSPAAWAQPLPTAPQEPAAEVEEGAEPRNELALVVAGTRDRAKGESSFTIGAEYERRLGDRVGIVGELEYVNGPDSWVFALPFVFRPTGNFKLFAGPGLERKPVEHEGETHESEAAATADTRENLFLWRVGTGYAWEFSERYVVGPSFYLDFVREEPGVWKRAFVFGISLGVAF